MRYLIRYGKAGWQDGYSSFDYYWGESPEEAIAEFLKDHPTEEEYVVEASPENH